MLKFENCEFAAQGADKKDKVYGITLSGAEDVVIENCIFANKGYAGVLNNCSGSVSIKDCKFNCDNIYNPIEGSQSVENGNVVVLDCVFEGIPGNNFINFYNVAEGSNHIVKNCSFAGSCDNNIIRLSNRGSKAATFNIDNCAYRFVAGTPSDYTGFMLCQDYTNKNGQKQDFSKYTVNISALDRPAEGCLFYVYEDGAGVITGQNDPKVRQ